MGSSEERNIKAIDASAGALVWVRRRNGSWWPGRIIGLDEVPDSSLVSPIDGTPIKLLGRDDASVDWYNLDKSKRVKVFRCGEYDACIEKAKAAAASSGKKVVKYARREDAIIHALEIENAQRRFLEGCVLEIVKENPCIEKASSSEAVPRRLRTRKDNENTVGNGTEELHSGPELLQSGVSLQEAKDNEVSSERPVSEKQRRTPNDSEDDGIDGIKRMRGLEDLEMGVGSKGKGQTSALVEHTRHENGLYDITLNDAISSGTLVNGDRVCPPSTKRKSSQVINASEHSKRKNRRRPLIKVLESTAMVSVPVTCDQLISSDCSPFAGFSDSNASGIDPIESMKCVSAVINNNSDSTGVSCENAISLNVSENGFEAPHNKAKDSESSSISVFALNDSSNRLFDVPLIREDKPFSGFSSAFTSCLPDRGEVSELTRPYGQSSHDNIVRNGGSNGSVCTSPAMTHVSDINGIEKRTSKWQLKGKRNSRQMSKKQEAGSRTDAYETNNFLLSCSVSTQKGQLRFSGYTRCGTQYHTGRNSALYEVKIEVKENHKPRNVPMVSLVSRLNRKAIVGHPLTVEVLEDGYCDHMVSSSTTRAVGVSMVEDYEMTQPVKPKSSSKKNSAKKKSHFCPRKPSKSKKSSCLSKKTRRLSALTGHKLSKNGKKVVTEKPKEHVVACIPLKVVFSRINEVVKGSVRQAHQRSLPSSANT